MEWDVQPEARCISHSRFPAVCIRACWKIAFRQMGVAVGGAYGWPFKPFRSFGRFLMVSACPQMKYAVLYITG